MKNKILIYTLIILFFYEFSLAEKYKFDVSNINVTDKGNTIIANDGKIVSQNKDLEIVAEKFKYNKNLDLLEANNGIAKLKIDGYELKFEKILINNKNLVLTASGGIQVQDEKNLLNIEGETVVLDQKNNILTVSDGIQVQDEKNLLNIKGETVVLDQKNNILTVSDGIQVQDEKNLLNIKGETVVLDQKNNILTVSDGIQVQDEKNLLNIKGETVVLDQKNNSLYSSSVSEITDKYQNKFKSNSFKYNLNKKLFELIMLK